LEKKLQVKYTALTPCSKMPSIWKEIMALSQLGQTGRAVILGNDKKYHFGKIDDKPQLYIMCN
jgi:hypothetical protein